MIPSTVLNPESIATLGLPSFLFARRYSENLFWFLFLALLRCFSSGGVPTYTYVFSVCWLLIKVAGFPHSEICGSMAICAYPQLIAAYHVFRRLLMPRHSPYALSNLISLLQVLLSSSLSYAKRIIWASVIYSSKLLVIHTSYVLPVLYVDNFYSIFCIIQLTIFIQTSIDVWWWRWGGSNSWPPACKAGALPAELHPHVVF